MFASRVCVGEYCKGKNDAREPDPKTHGGYDLYGSTVDDVRTPGIFVTYHDSQAYPQYLVRFEID